MPAAFAVLLEVLSAAHSTGSVLDLDDVTPYLTDAGAVPGYQLTNAIADGDTPTALEVLERLLTVSSPRQPKPMHPLQVMALLHSHYRRLLRLDDPSVHSPADAIGALGGGVKEYPARKALEQARVRAPRAFAAPSTCSRRPTSTSRARAAPPRRS